MTRQWGFWVAAAAMAAALTTGCVRGPPRVGGLDEAVRAQKGAYISGRILAVDDVAVVEDRDFVYGLALSPDGGRVVHTRLAGETFNVMLWRLPPMGSKDAAPQLVSDLPLGHYEFDVEGVAFSPDGSVFVTAGRDGVVRAFGGEDGQPQGEWHGDARLVSVGFTTDGRHVVAGGEDGGVVVLAWPGLTFVSESRPHEAEVRAVVALPDGRVVTGSWDKTIALLRFEERPLPMDAVRLGVRLTRKNVALVRAGIDGNTGGFSMDASLPHVVVSTALARRAGIEPSLITETVTVGDKPAKLVRGRNVHLKHLVLEGVDVAVCDACVPQDAHGVLGGAVLQRFEVTPTDGGKVLALRRRLAEGEVLPEGPAVPTLVEDARHRFEPFVNDLSVDRSGKRLGVAFSNDKAERNREVYQREKKGDPAPHSPNDYPAVVDVQSGQVVAKWEGHLGVVASVGISPDGRSVASGGWDKQLLVFEEGTSPPVAKDEFGWTLRRVRFSEDGRLLGVGAWTPQKAVGNKRSDPSAVIYDVAYREADVVPPQTP